MSKPWDNEPSPLTDAACKGWCERWHNETDQLTCCLEHAEDLERRLRHAEWVLDVVLECGSVNDQYWVDDIKAHLAAAQEADSGPESEDIYGGDRKLAAAAARRQAQAEKAWRRREAAKGGRKEIMNTEKSDECPCVTWCDASLFGERVITGHHAKCPHAPNRYKCALDLIKQLADGMTSWAHDCDGVHPDAWEAYRRAMLLQGVIVGEEEQC